MAKVLIYKTSGGGISCKVNLGEKFGITYHKGKGKLFRWNRGADRNEYPLIVSFSYLESFLSANDIDYKTVEIDKRSVDMFYGYSAWNTERFIADLTPAKVAEWRHKYEAPDLYRYTTNKDGHTNWFGLKLICFSDRLIEQSWSGIYVSNGITEEEVIKLTKGYENTRLAEEMWRALNAQRLSDGEIEFLTEEVKKYEEKIQAVIDKHKDEILASIAGMRDGAYGLDCGFLNIYTKNSKYNEQKGLLRNVRRNDLNSTPWMNVRMPYEPQSLTIKEREFQKIKEIVARELGEELYCKTMLD